MLTAEEAQQRSQIEAAKGIDIPFEIKQMDELIEFAISNGKFKTLRRFDNDIMERVEEHYKGLGYKTDCRFGILELK